MNRINTTSRPFRVQEDFDFFLDEEDEDDSLALKPGRMGNRLNATGTSGRLPTTEELDEEQDNDGSDVEHDAPKTSMVGSDRRQSLAVSVMTYSQPKFHIILCHELLRKIHLPR